MLAVVSLLDKSSQPAPEQEQIRERSFSFFYTTFRLLLIGQSVCVFSFLSSIQTGLCSVISEAGPRLRGIDRPNELWLRALVTQSEQRQGETHGGLRGAHTAEFLNLPT